MKRIVRGLVSLGIMLVCGGTAMAEATLSTSNAPQFELDATIDAVLRVERIGLGRMDQRDLNRFGAVPDEDATSLVGFNRAALARLPKTKGGPQWACLAEALYFEARGESVTGQFAVAEVILNRVESASYPDTVCGVIRQGTGRRHACQFSYNCDGRAEVFNEPKAYEMVGKVARLVLDRGVPGLTDGATHYLTKSVRPSWSRVFPRTATIGFHHFYRQPLRVSKR